jgi:putative peptidoglycan lipid II flippase
LLQSFGKFAITGLILAGVLWLTARFSAVYLANMHVFRDEIILGILVLTGALVYTLCILALFGRNWLVALTRN